MHGRKWNNSSLNNAWSGASARDRSERQDGKRKFKKKTNKEQAAFLRAALARDVKETVRIDRRKNELERLTRDLTFENRHKLAALNPYAGKCFRACLQLAMAFTPTGMDAHAVTLISDTLNSDMGKGWPSLDRARELVVATLSGFNYLMIIQVGFRRISNLEVDARGSSRYVYHRLMCLHVHGIVWGPERLIEKRLDKLPRALGAKGGDLQPCYHDVGWLRYALGDPRQIECSGKTTKKVRGFIRQADHIPQWLQAKTVRYKHGVTKPELCIALGHGQKVLERAIMAAQIMGYAALE